MHPPLWKIQQTRDPVTRRAVFLNPSVELVATRYRYIAICTSVSMADPYDYRTFVARGTIHARRQSHEGYVISVDGVLVDLGYGDPPDEADFEADIVVDALNAHTHCADYGLDIPAGLSLEELVAPPNGLKHRYLSSATDSDLMENMKRFSHDSHSSGAASFIDFRERGLGGCIMLRNTCPESIILGRPTSDTYDPDEIARILDVADGIGISSISDMPFGYIEDVADQVRESRKIFAIHASERVREDISNVLSLDPAFIVHMCEATDDDLLECAEAEVPIVVCPTSNRYFGKEAPVANMVGCGVDVAVGTDNGMLCRPDIIKESRHLASLADSQGDHDFDVWRPLTVLTSKILNRSHDISYIRHPRSVAVVPRGTDVTVTLECPKNRR